MSTFKMVIFMLLRVIIINSLMVHHTTYQISSVQIPNISHHKHTQSCIFTQLEIKSVSFPNFNQFNVPTTLKHIDPHAITKYNYTQYNMKYSINILPTTLHDIIINIHINLATIHNSLCLPVFIIVPIINNNIKLKCIMQKWNSITNTMQYKCNPSKILPSTPSTTIFYSINNEYKSALKSYNKQRRRLFYSNESNETYVPITSQININALKQHTNSKFKIKPLVLWIIIGALIIFIPVTFCVLYLYCRFQKRNKKITNTTDNENETLQNKNGINKHKNNTSIPASNKSKTDDKNNNTKYTAIPINENTFIIEGNNNENNINNQQQPIIEMANFVHGTGTHIINLTDSNSSDTNDSHNINDLNDSNE
eukprot:63075_1